MTIEQLIDPRQATLDRTAAFTTEAVTDRLFTAILGSMQVQAAYLGDRLGWYRALAAHGPLTPSELAARTGSDERYAREWLEHQTVSQYLICEDASLDARSRRYLLPDGARPVLADRDDLGYLLPFARMAATFGKTLDDVAEAYRSGGGVSWAHHGADAREGQAEANRPFFLHALGDALASVPELAAVLDGTSQHDTSGDDGTVPGRAVRVADIGNGFGWSGIGLARRFGGLTVDGFDVDGPSVTRANELAQEFGVGDRVRSHEIDVAELGHREVESLGAYDLVLALECIHDLPDPVAVLAGMRRLAGERGLVVVMDERVGETFTGEPDPVEQAMYGYSIVGCLPDGRAHAQSAMTGTVMRPATLRAYAEAAGFAGVGVLPIENDFFRFYLLRSR